MKLDSTKNENANKGIFLATKQWDETWAKWQHMYDLGFGMVPAAARTKLPAKGYGFKHLRSERLTPEAFDGYRRRFWQPRSCDMVLCTGDTPGTKVVVVDPDSEEAEGLFRERCPESPMQTRTRRGRHRYFRHPGNGWIGQIIKLKYKGKQFDLDVKADGNIVVAPGSLHEKGHLYDWVEPWTPEMLASLPVYDPAWLPQDRDHEVRSRGEWNDYDHDRRCDEESTPMDTRIHRASRYAAACPGTTSGEGEASNAALRLAGKIAIGFLLPYDEAVEIMDHWGGREDQNPKWTTAQIEHKVQDAIRTAERYPGEPGDMLTSNRGDYDPSEFLGEEYVPQDDPEVETEDGERLQTGTAVTSGEEVIWCLDEGEPAGCEAKVEAEPETPREDARVDAVKGNLRDDPMFDYLWRGVHGRRLTDADRTRRVASQNRLWSMIPQTGFFPTYIRANIATTDAPVIFHLASALAAASNLVHRKVWFTEKSAVYPNLWLGIIAPSGVRKSTALTECEDLINTDPQYQRTIVADGFTYESFMMRVGRRIEGARGEMVTTTDSEGVVRELDEANLMMKGDITEGVASFHAHELGGLLQRLAHPNCQGLKEDLTRYYDPHRLWRKTTVTKGEYLVWRPFVNIIGCSTTDWFTENLKQSDVASGFLPRFLFFHADERDQDFLLTRRERPEGCWMDRLAKEAADLKRCRGGCDLTPEADDHYHTWRLGLAKKESGELAPWVARLGVYAFKIATLFEASVSGGSMPPEVSLASLQYATNLCDYSLAKLPGFLHSLNFEVDEVKLGRMEKAIRCAKRIKKSTLLKQSKLTKRAFDPLIETLLARESVKKEEVTTAGRTGDVFVWVGD